MKNNGKRIILFGILLFSILTIFQKIYAQYIINRAFSVNVTTAKFDVSVRKETIDIYHVGKNYFSVSITNNNDYSIKGDIKFKNQMITEFEIPAKTTKEISDMMLTPEMVSGLTADIYDLDIAINTPYTTVIKDVKIYLKGTITNVERYNVTVPGTRSDPFLVYAVEDFIRFTYGVDKGHTYAGKIVKQLRNIDFQNDEHYYDPMNTIFGDLNGNDADGNTVKVDMTTGEGFLGIGKDATPFMGTYDGDGKAIQNLYMHKTSSAEREGLFRCIRDGNVENLSLEGIINAVSDAGTLAGTLYGNCNITNCHNSADVINTAPDFSIGGFIGTAMPGSKVKLERCSNTGNVTNVTAGAGLVGLVFSSELEIIDCYNTGDITTSHNNDWAGTAGLVVKDSSSGGTIKIIRSYNSGNITGYANVAGLVSTLNGTLTIDSCYNTGNIKGTNKIGGILGWQRNGTVTITNTYTSGNITGSTNVGGIVGLRTAGTTTYSTAYYLNTSASNAIGNISGSANARTSTVMMSQDFITTLGGNFRYNSGGYPKLIWQ